MLSGCHPDVYATLTLRDALKRIWRGPGDQFGEPSQVLGDGGQNKFILGPSWATQSNDRSYRRCMVFIDCTFKRCIDVLWIVTQQDLGCSGSHVCSQPISPA